MNDKLIDDINNNIDKIIEEYDLDKEQLDAYKATPILDKHLGDHQCRHFSDGDYCHQRVYYKDDTYCYYHKKINLGLITPIIESEQKVWKNRLGVNYYNQAK